MSLRLWSISGHAAVLLLVTLSATSAPGGAPAPRTDHTAVWTGSEMIVWGGRNAAGVINSGGRYNPATQTWAPTSTNGAPSPRMLHTAVWTGSEMIVFGGFNWASGIYFADGARYSPTTDTWTPLPSSDSPSPRANHTATWTGTQMVVWAGASNSAAIGEVYLNDGAAFTPGNGTWSAISTLNAPAPRVGHTALWNGTQVILWGGLIDNGVTDPYKDNSGGRFNTSANVWAGVNLSGVPSHRTEHSAVWTGSRMIVWGGLGNGTLDYWNTGGRYDPATDSWIATTTNNAPAMRQLHTAVWTGTQMIVWGGRASSTFRGTGGRYDPNTDSWTALPTSGAPDARAGHTAVWTGTEMIVFGGEGSGGTFFDTLGRYRPAQDIWSLPPQCALMSPSSGASIPGGSNILLTASANDADGTVALVEFFADGAFTGSRATPTNSVYTCFWTNPATGGHTLRVVATDNVGVKSTSAPVNVTITTPQIPPNVALTNPMPNSQIEMAVPVNLSAAASDPDGSVAQVTFLANGTTIGTDTSPPFSRLWTNAALGQYNLTAVAIDNMGLARTSALVQVESVLRPLISIARSPTHYTLNMTGCETGRTYRVEFSTNLGGAWIPFSTNVASNGTFTITNTPPSNAPARFYRAVP